MTESARRVCLFTGAGGRLGAMFCSRYAQAYDIVAVYRNRLPAAPSQEAAYVDPCAPDVPHPLNRHPVTAIRADLRDDADLEMVVDRTLTQFGRIDLLVNAAVHSVWAPIDSARLAESMAEQFHVNAIVPLKIAASVSRQYWRHRQADENTAAGRNVVNVSSTAGVYAYPHTGQSVYAATKAALNMITCHMADEFQTMGVRANAAAPNSFEIVPSWRVTDAIVAFDRGHDNGRILVMDHDGDYAM